MLKKTRKVALVGNPNIGKTTLFNRLTGLRQQVGNYPGVTVEKKVGTFESNGEWLELVDLPGTYSFSAASLDERIVIDALRGNIETLGDIDLVVCILDATNLKRNLFLASQVAELGKPMLLVLNQWDGLKKQGLKIDCEKLQSTVGVPVVPCSARKGRGVDKVKAGIGQALEQQCCMKAMPWPEFIAEAVTILSVACSEQEKLKDSEFLLRRWLFDGEADAELQITDAQKEQALSEAQSSIRQAGYNPKSVEAVLKYEHLGKLLEEVVSEPDNRNVKQSDSIDKVLTHRVWGLAIFCGMMWFVFQSVYAWSGPFMDFIDAGTGWLQGAVSGWFVSTPALQSLIVDGVIAGVGGVIIFLPQIFVLFFFVGLLEDTGYMARAAFLMDRLLGWCGLSGKSFVPLLSSYACAVPGVMATRTIEDPKARLTTILIAPLMSCSARLPVYVLLIGAFVEPKYGAAVAGLVLFLIHFVGLAVAVPVAWLLNRFVLKTKPLPFLLEMSPYRIPRLRDLLWRMWLGGKEFTYRAGTLIFAMSIIIWALLYYPRSESVAEEVRESFIAERVEAEQSSPEMIVAQLEAEESELAVAFEKHLAGAYIEQSYMGRMGKSVQPVFEAAGFDWKITVGVLASFPAREVIIATLGIIYNLGGDIDEESGDLRSVMVSETWNAGSKMGQPVFTLPTVFALMVFFALCLQCGATVAAIVRESNWKWALFAFTYMTTLAWLGAVLTYGVGSLIL